MKFEKYIYCILLVTVLFSSCKDNNVFDETPITRIKKELKVYDELLKSDGGIWRVAYKPLDADSTIFIFKFKNECDVVMFENEKSSESTFNLNFGQGPVLSFDTYSILHYYSDPDVFNNDVTLGGDYEFVLHSRTDDRIVAVGKKNRTEFVMTRVNDGEENRARLQLRLNPDFKKGYSIFFALKTKSGRLADFTLSEDQESAILRYKSGTQPMEFISKLNFTADGFLFDTPFTIDGESISKLDWDEDTNTFKSDNAQLVEVNSTEIPVIDNSVDTLFNKVYDVVAVSPSLTSAVSSIAKAYPQFDFMQVSFVERKVLDQLHKGFLSYVFNVNDTLKWNNFNALNMTVSGIDRRDQISFTPGLNDGDKVNELRRNASVKKINDIFFSSTGHTVLYKQDKIYLVSKSNAKNWMIFGEPSIINQ